MSRKCRGSWIETYMEYTQGQESPHAFHEWVALSLIGAAVGRHVWLPRIKYTIYPNLFVILVAGSARCRKSVSMKIGMDVLKGLEKPPMIFAQKLTTEALIQALNENKEDGTSAGLIAASELSVFMGADANKSGIIPALTDLYDSPAEWVYHTRGRGKEVLRNVTLSVLAASTQDWLRMAIPPDAVGGGFTSRIIFVYQDKPSRSILFPEDNSIDEDLRVDLINDLNVIREKVKGPMEFTPQAKEVSRAWYESEYKRIRDSKLDGYFGRKHDTMFKVAIILSIAETNNRVITHVHIKKALALLEENEANLSGIVASVVAKEVGQETERLLNLIKSHKSIKHSDLVRKSWRFISSKDIATHLETLIMSGEIVDEVEGRAHVYKYVPSKYRD